MTALAEDTSRGECTTPRQKFFPARALNQAGDPIVFYKGAIIAKRLGSKLVEIPEAAYPRTDLIPLGVCECKVDMTGLADSDRSVLVNPGLLRPFQTGSSTNEITANHVGQTWYMYDDTTAYLTDDGGTLSPGGTIGMMEPNQTDGTTELALYFDCEMPQVLLAIASFKQSLAVDAPTELTLVGGSATVTQSNHYIDSEADAASDDFDTVVGMVANQMYLFRASNAARTIVIRDVAVSTTGNIRTPFGQSISLAESDDWALGFSDGVDVTIVAFRTLSQTGGGAGVLIGDLTALTTTDKTSAVAAINEVRVPVAQILTSRTTTVGARLLLAEGTDNGTSKVTIAAPNALAGDVTVSLPTGSLDLAVVPTMQAVNATLVNGTVTIAAGIVVAATSEVFAFPKGAITGSTNFGSVQELFASRSVPGTVVIQAVGNDGLIDADAAGVVRVVILTPAG